MEWEAYRDVLQVVLTCPFYLDVVIPMPTLLRDGKVHQLRSRPAFINDLAAVATGIRTDLNDMIRCRDDILIVLHHHNRVAQVAQLTQHMNQALRVPRMQTDGRLVQHIQTADQTAA